ncbi:hypothetical protein JCM13304A_05970 [Desulfothermus okinawensis JCM 13304]
MKRKYICFFILILLIPGVLYGYTESKFISFLKRYGAYNVINIELKDKSKKDKSILAYANSKIFSGSPDEAISILKGVDFKDEDLLAKLEFTLARAYRYKGDFYNGLLHYAKAFHLSGDPRQLLKEPDIRNFFKSVILKWSLDLLYTGSFLNNDKFLRQKKEVLDIIKISQILWPKDKEFTAIYHSILRLNSKDFSFSLSNNEIRDSIISFLASLAIKYKNNINSSLKLFKNPSQRYVLDLVYEKINNDEISLDHKSDLLNIPKCISFFDILIKRLNQNKWIITNSSYLLKKLKIQSQLVGVNNFLNTINGELNSVFVPSEIKEELKQIKIALILMNKDYGLLKKELPDMDFKKLPLSLKISILLLLDKVSSLDIGLTKDEFKEICLFLQPFGFNPYGFNSDFDIPNQEIEKKLNMYPLDYFLRYAYLKNTIINGQGNEAQLKQAIFLYKETILGQMAILKLAKNVIDTGNTTLFKKYIELFDYKNLNQSLLINYYKLMIDYYTIKNNFNKAMSYYEKIFEISPDSLNPEELIKVALYYQKNSNIDLSQKIFKHLWNNKDNLNRKIQAEILFWMAECHQIQGNLDVAIDEYLKVYWFYRDQYIWSITGLYRAALIYEQKGNLYIAKKILRDVVKNARRKSEKEAAQARLNDINKKINATSQKLFWF